LRPWHIVIEYDQFDGDGDNIHSGVVDEVWAALKKYRLSYKSDNLSETDYATEQGLFRVGDQRWPNRAEDQVLAEVVDPFSYAATLQGFQIRNVERTFGLHALDCSLLERTAPGAMTGPTQYCFEPNTQTLRYVRGFGWDQTTYNDLTSFQGHNAARDVVVTDGGKPYLKLHVKTIEVIEHLNEADFVPPTDASHIGEKRLSGVRPKVISTLFPEWPGSLRQQHFVVTVEIVIGKDGHVVAAHAVTGPSEAYKAAEKAVLKWVFQPHLVLGEPAELETKVELSNN
jgi:hypothetical protein